jgi:iron complex transport system ATP-binding protein
MTAPLMELEDVRLSVAGRVLIGALSMRVQRDELWCVLGRNGAGKTLLLQTMAGLRGVQGGTIRMNARCLATWPRDDAARFRAFLPQVAYDAFSLSVMDAVLVARHPRLSRWGWESDDDRALVQVALAAVDLTAMADRDVMTLSGGERQRVAIAALLAQNTPLMLLDEPLSHLDLRHQILVMSRLQALASSGDRGIVMSLHDINLAARYATHAVLFREEGAVDVGRIADVANERALSVAYGYPITRVTTGERVMFVAD